MEWSYMIHCGIIAAALLLGTLLRSRISFLRRLLVPASIIGGLIMLFFYNYAAPALGMNAAFLGDLVYHLLNLSFIAMMLRVPEGNEKRGKEGRQTLGENTVGILAQYGLQCLFGLLITALLIITIAPNLFPAFGFTLPLGFELGPGQAYSVSIVWEPMGFTGASSVGLTMAAIGFIIGSIGGVILINIGIRKGWVDKKTAEEIRNRGYGTGFLTRKNQTVGAKLTTDGEAVDSFTYHLALVLFTYLISWGLLTLIGWLLAFIGPMGEELATSLWGVNFVFSTLCALLVKKIMQISKIDYTIDNSTCTRISGLATDMTVAASLGAISLTAISGYLVPVLVLTLTGILITCFILPWYSSRLYHDHQFFRMLLLYGTATGTLPTGLSLLRVVDPDFETSVASDYIYATGIMFALAIPIILCINLPAYSVTRNNPALFWLAVAISAVYAIVALVGYIVFAKKRAFKNPRKLFYVADAE